MKISNFFIFFEDRSSEEEKRRKTQKEDQRGINRKGEFKEKKKDSKFAQLKDSSSSNFFEDQ